MERRAWGITHNSDQSNTFLSNTNRKRGVMFSGVDLSGNLNRSTLSDDDQIVVDEVDFFSDKNKERAVINVKKETSHGDGPKNNLDTALYLLTTNTGSDQSTVDDGVSLSSDGPDNRAKNELVLLQAELERMNAENQRLTTMLSHVTNNYNALQMHLMAIMQQQQQQQNLRGISSHEHEMEVLKLENKRQEGVDDQIRPRQFMELGPISATTETDNDQHSQSSSEERTHSGSHITNQNNTTELVTTDHHQSKKNKGIQIEEMPESETWVPKKVMKVSEPRSVDQATEATMRKVRVSVRARSEAPMITDGCQWRKYGQKMAKGNPCPRAYYRCTMALGCPVRKQVQRCAEDKTILITTYEGTHNHPLPPAAMAMASTTSAAANMLLSGSMPSADGLMNPNFLARAILPCSSSVATISASAPFPTVTLDLTHSPNPLQLQRPQTQFNGPIANMGSQDGPLLFGQPLHNQSKFSGLQMSQGMSSAQLGQLVQNHAFSADTLNAATAAIAADPNFTAALAAAISSIIGGGHQNSSDNNNTTSNATTNASNGNNINIGGFREN